MAEHITNREGKGDYARFRSKGQAGFWTRALFADVLEHLKEPDANAPYWLNRNQTGDSRPVLRTHFLATGDMTGYETAIKYLGCMEHWDVMVKRCPWFRDSLALWRKELLERKKAQALQKIYEIMASDSSQALGAAKYIMAIDEEPKSSAGRGRPSQAEVTGELKKHVKTLSEDQEDLDRIGLKLN